MFDKACDFIHESLTVFFIPLITSYFALTSHVFFATAHQEAVGLEKIANTLFAPCHYLYIGQQVTKNEHGLLEFKNRYDYNEHFLLKSAACTLVAIPSFISGSILKAASFISPESRAHQQGIAAASQSTQLKSNHTIYQSLGLAIPTSRPTDWLISQGVQRRAGDENNLAADKIALKQMAQLLDEANITWWVDCGTCLGAYRYGGVIPWDMDIDIAVLRPDFDNVLQIFKQLDPKIAFVEDWSSREHPKSLLKVFVRDSTNAEKTIDVYHYNILPQERKLQFILAHEHAYFLSDLWKKREAVFTTPVSYDVVFPLKRARFDGIEINVPHDTTAYLQRFYGENLNPAKIYDPQTDQYERDLSHPYWRNLKVGGERH